MYTLASRTCNVTAREPFATRSSKRQYSFRLWPRCPLRHNSQDARQQQHKLKILPRCRPNLNWASLCVRRKNRLSADPYERFKSGSFGAGDPVSTTRILFTSCYITGSARNCIRTLTLHVPCLSCCFVLQSRQRPYDICCLNNYSYTLNTSDSQSLASRVPPQ